MVCGEDLRIRPTISMVMRFKKNPIHICYFFKIVNTYYFQYRSIYKSFFYGLEFSPLGIMFIKPNSDLTFFK
ncbi:hypothetical protein HanPSC8_Chr08g0317031 [Helianthus annuus]|nr:hypothetical protein HanPSC8_Chr08g0317031 [Helianthus annuus]